MDAINPRGNVINVVAIGENPDGNNNAVLSNNTTNESLNYVPKLMQIIGKYNEKYYKVKTNTDRSLG